MAVESIDIALKTKMPEFELPDAFGKMYRSRDLLGKAGLLVAFTCNHCPYAVAVWPRLVRLATFAKKSGINVVAINPNIHPEYPDDDPKVMKEKVKDWKVEFPYLVDESQKTAAAVAELLGHAGTPLLFYTTSRLISCFGVAAVIADFRDPPERHRETR